MRLAGAGKEGRAWYRTLREAGIGVAGWVDVDPRKVPVDGPKMLITVGTKGARDGVRQWASAAGFREGENVVCVT